MTTLIQYGIIATITTIAVASLAWYHLSVWKVIWRSQHDTSRFPMFAVRTKLIMLVASGDISEDNPAWMRLYESANFLLQLRLDLNELACLWNFVRFQVTMERHPDMRARWERERTESDALALQVPEFGVVRDECSKALARLVQKRTRPTHRATIFAITVLAMIALFANRVVSMISARNGSKPRPGNHHTKQQPPYPAQQQHSVVGWVHTVKNVATATQNPSPADISGWRDYQHYGRNFSEDVRQMA